MNPFHHDVVAGPAQYRPEWDVPELNAGLTNRLVEQLTELRSNGRVRRIPVLLATPGHGKTHLFGRIAHRLAEDVVFVFVPQVEDTDRPLDHIRRATIESLFRTSGDRPSLMDLILARRCHESVRECFHALPPTLRAENRQFGERLDEDSREVLGMVSRVHVTQPFQHLARSIVASFPQCNSSVMRALALGWSPLKQTARRWLRGEDLSDEALESLGLPAQSCPPTANEVLRCIAALLPGDMPIVLCCDQLEVVLGRPSGLMNLANGLVGLLQDEGLSNLLIVLTCLEERWRNVTDVDYSMFYDRVDELKLNDPLPNEIVDLIRRRLHSWPEHRTGSTWPFDEVSLLEWADREHPSPRGALKSCASEFEQWKLAGQWEQPIFIGGETARPLEELFREEWERELAAIRKDDNRSYRNMDEARLNQALLATLELARQFGPRSWNGARLVSATERAVPSTGNTQRYGHLLNFQVGGGQENRVAFLTTTDNTRSFTSHMTALETTLNKRTARCVLIHPSRDLPFGKNRNSKGKQIVDRLSRDDRLVLFPLVDQQETCEQLECYWTLRSEALSGNLLLGQHAISVDDFDELAVKELKYLDHLKLLEILLGTVDVETPPTTDNGDAVPAGHADSIISVNDELVAESLDDDHSFDHSGTIDDPGHRSTQASFSATQQSPTVEPDINSITVAHTATAEHITGREAAREKMQPRSQPDSSARDWAESLLKKIVDELWNFSVEVAPLHVKVGARFARLTVIARGTTSINRIRNRAEDLKVRLADIDHTPVIDSQSDGVSIDVQLPSQFRHTVTLDEVLADTTDYSDSSPLFPVGQDVAGRGYLADLSDPNHAHYLVAGTTGSGKSEFLKAVMAGMASRLSPEQLRFFPIDPKRVTFQLTNPSPYFGPPNGPHTVAHTASEARPLLSWCAEETERRYKLLSQRRVNDLTELDPDDASTPPRVVVVCDEFPDLVSDLDMKRDLEQFLIKTATKARAAGIHLILAAQRPEAKVVTPQLRSNLPGRICLRVASAADSKIVLDQPEAADLLGKGDLLWRDGVGIRRLQAPLVTQEEFAAALRIL